MQRFNSINLESRFIKNILQNTYMPTLPIVKDGDLIVSGVEYCYKNSLIRCEKTGVLNHIKSVVNGINYVERNDYNPSRDQSMYTPSCSTYAVCAADFICGVGVGTATYEYLGKISSHEFMPGLNYKYKSHTAKYDPTTHRHLGNYLRWYRDSYGIDLLPLYNCYCGETYTLAYIDGNKLKSGYDSSKSVQIVPIQLNQQYTIFINSPHKVSICGSFLNSNGRVLNPLKEDNKEYIDEYLDNVVTHHNTTKYSSPILYEAYTTDPKLLSYSNQFYIVIQTDTKHFCPIVVLEGDYRKSPNKLVNSLENMENVPTANINYEMFNYDVNPSLVIAPTTYHVPYSNRLIEFLTENTITNTEDIQKNISRIQYELDFKNSRGDFTDVWSTKLKYVLYNKYFKYGCKNYFTASQLNGNYMPKESVLETNPVPEELKIYDSVTGDWVGIKAPKLKRMFETKYDITGYVDKDVENSLYKYRSV